MGTSVPLLDYGRPPSIRRRLWAWGRRLVLLGWVAGTLYLAYDKCKPWAFAKTEVMRWQSRCATFSIPPRTVFFESDPILMLALLKSREVKPVGASNGLSANPDAVIDPQAEKAISALDDAQTEARRIQLGRLPDIPDIDAPLTESFSETSGVPIVGTVIFLHERTDERGEKRLVTVSAGWYSEKPSFFRIDGTTRRMESWWQTPANEPAVTTSFDLHHPDRIYAGQFDPEDSSRFTIDCIVDDKPVQLTGHLSTDGKIEWSQQTLDPDE